MYIREEILSAIRGTVPVNAYTEKKREEILSKPYFEEALAELSVKLRNMKDENGDPLGYTADTLILPSNRPIAEIIAKKVAL